LSNSGGSLPSALSSTTKYYVVNKTTNNFQVATTVGGDPVLFSENGTGTQYYSTTFYIPDFRQKVSVGLDSNSTNFNYMGRTGGETTHTLSINEIPIHYHVESYTPLQGVYGTTGPSVNGCGYPTTANTGNAGGGLAHNNLQPYSTTNKIIKY
jgi:microcystin-dependent protein